MLSRIGRTRSGGGPAARDCHFAVVDLETTGLFARAHHRVIEVAVVELDGANQEIVDEWSTLVNPRRDLGLSGLHGVWTRDLVDAPAFSEIAGDLLVRLEGRVFAAHNARFDSDFLAAEYARLGVVIPELPSVCTVRLAGRYSQSAGRGLAQCCASAGIDLVSPHTALGDARATARLLGCFLETAAREGRTTLEALGCSSAEFPDSTVWPHVPPSGRVASRRSEGAPLEEQAFLARLVERLGKDDGGGLGNEAGDYLDVLDRALEDRHLAADESQALFDLAEAWNISRAEAEFLHERYLARLVAAALADGLVTEPEKRDLELVADLLAVERERLSELLGTHDLAARPAERPSEHRAALVGKSVCFTGAMTARIKGEPITRARAEELAVAAGLVVAPAVTKKLEILVVADPDSLSGKARKARGYGTRIIAERAFWQALGVAVD